MLLGDAGAHGWRRWFLGGLLLPAALLHPPASVQFAGGYAWIDFAGLFVGVGTRLGSGCTSGHGVCGVARGSLRSVVATLTFMATAMLTVYWVRHGS